MPSESGVIMNFVDKTHLVLILVLMENALREQKIKVIIYQQLSHTTLKE